MHWELEEDTAKIDPLKNWAIDTFIDLNLLTSLGERYSSIVDGFDPNELPPHAPMDGLSLAPPVDFHWV